MGHRSHATDQTFSLHSHGRTLKNLFSKSLGQCGNPQVQAGRVIAGDDAKKGAWPWQILMLYNGRTMCGGSLVAPNWVVTAAHCIDGRESQARSFKIR